MELAFFFALAAVAIASSISVVLQKNPVYSALSLVLSLIAVAGLYLLLNAQFVAAMQVIIYAGSIMVLFLFVIMLISFREAGEPAVKLKTQKLIGILLSFVLLAAIGYIAPKAPKGAMVGEYTPEKINAIGNVRLFGQILFSDYVFLFEVTSVLLLVAIVGAIVLARRGRARMP